MSVCVMPGRRSGISGFRSSALTRFYTIALYDCNSGVEIAKLIQKSTKTNKTKMISCFHRISDESNIIREKGIK